MRFNRAKIIAAAVAAAAILLITIFVIAARPQVKAPQGTAPLDNKLDTESVAHILVDEANVLSDKTENILSVYNANWNVMVGRVMAVVTVERVENAEDAAWEWFETLSLGDNDALLLMETQGSKDCVIVSRGTFHEDLSGQVDGFVDSLTYMSIRAGEFDTAALTVFERMHYFIGYERDHAAEGRIAFSILAVIVFLILFHLISEKIDNRRFKRWYERYGITDPIIVAWRTLIPWHRAGSKWYNRRVSGEWSDYGKVIRRGRKEAAARANPNSGLQRGMTVFRSSRFK